MNKRHFLLALLTALAAGTLHAQQAKPVRIIVAFAPGGPVGAMAHNIAEPLSRVLGRPVVVDNRPGASGAIGAAEVLRSDPDGSTMWLTSVGAAAINPALYPKMSYNMMRDFAPVSLVANNVELFVANAKNPANDAAELMALARQRKEPMPIASSGKGSIPHLAMAQLEQATGIDLLHVPFNGMGPALTNLMGGQVEGVFADVPAVLGQVRSGRLKPMGIASKTRHPLLPEVKTFEEQGFKAVDTNNWYALFVSAKTPPEVIKALNRAVQTVLTEPATATKIAQSGAEPKGSTPEELAALLKTDTDKWAQIVRARNITADE